MYGCGLCDSSNYWAPWRSGLMLSLKIGQSATVIIFFVPKFRSSNIMVSTLACLPISLFTTKYSVPIHICGQVKVQIDS